MKRLTILALTAALVTVAVPVASHEFTNSDPENPGAHTCSGEADWTQVRAISTFGTTLQGSEVRVYLDTPPHGEPESQNPETPAPGVRMPGALWLEANGLTGLQKADYVCVSTDGAHNSDPQVHSDQVLL